MECFPDSIDSNMFESLTKLEKKHGRITQTPGFQKLSWGDKKFFDGFLDKITGFYDTIICLKCDQPQPPDIAKEIERNPAQVQCYKDKGDNKNRCPGKTFRFRRNIEDHEGGLTENPDIGAVAKEIEEWVKNMGINTPEVA